ncbi:hypothetical protein K4A83_02140 [Spirulina subsalsa FACHB-351]|uniref:Uncharacterized protein n=1 Tax=Spirulina subsalsa FACHB-351 TaxID=234711 RepID=A0ABT3L0P3_9CYAN|nr:hypothetical protein [Spirulina subsalsa]MCW6035074.1 hypothetical protein [Spirulina subsalsa FACHB-351]
MNFPDDSRQWVIAALAEKLAETRELQEQYAKSNNEAIAALAQQIQDNQRLDLELIQANSHAIRDLITSLDKLQRIDVLPRLKAGGFIVLRVSVS